MKSELSGANSTLRNLHDELRRLDAQSQQQQEDLYTVEFKVQQMERKVKRAQGVRYVLPSRVTPLSFAPRQLFTPGRVPDARIRSEEEKVKLKATIAELEEQLEKKKERHKILAAQIRKIETDLNLSNRKLEEVSTAQFSRTWRSFSPQCSPSSPSSSRSLFFPPLFSAYMRTHPRALCCRQKRHQSDLLRKSQACNKTTAEHSNNSAELKRTETRRWWRMTCCAWK